MLLQEIKYEIKKQLGIRASMQNLIHAGHILEENLTLHDCVIVANSTIILNMRL